jgi:hypothetical protein
MKIGEVTAEKIAFFFGGGTKRPLWGGGEEVYIDATLTYAE